MVDIIEFFYCFTFSSSSNFWAGLKFGATSREDKHFVLRLFDAIGLLQRARQFVMRAGRIDRGHRNDGRHIRGRRRPGC